MRNYVIINGVNSLTIQGLAINNLPPITKPMIRTQREEIDGRDGDIVTELGYSAYDKQIEIGLWGTYDINDIIKYFTGEGTIVFSNEEDKCYNFKILDQIDYEKLLKFKTATITFHCQPFKYPLEEEPVEAEITTLTGTGTTLTLNNTEEAPMSLVYKGNTLQNGTPTPDNPIPIQVVSGDNSIVVCGKNLFKPYTNTGTITSNGVSYTMNSDYTITINGTATGNTWVEILEAFRASVQASTTKYLNLDSSKTYSIKANIISGTYTGQTKFYTQINVSGGEIYSNLNTASSISNSDGLYRAWFRVYNGDVFNNLKIGIQLEEGEATTYEAYTGESYPISLGDIQLLHIPNTNYYDKIDKSSGKNLFDGEIKNIAFGSQGSTNVVLESSTYRGCYISCEAGKTYSVSRINNSNRRFRVMFSSSIPVAQTEIFGGTGNVDTYDSALKIENITAPENAKYLVIYLSNSSQDIPPIMINEGTTALEYEPYGTGWYVKKEIGKLNLSSIPFSAINTASTDTTRVTWYSIARNYQEDIALCDKLPYNINIWNRDTQGFAVSNSTGYVIIRINKSIVGTTEEEINTYLSNNDLIFYSPLATPTYTLIEDSTLIEELESMKKSYENQTNISQVNNDMPFELDVSVTFLTPMEINNIGNIYAKPILTIEGTGNIGVVLNDIQILDIDLTNNGKIAIDVTKLEAYNPDDDTLLNRLVTGDYMKLLINEGENTITFTGNVSSATLTNYIRWI